VPYRPTERTEAKRAATRERVVSAARELIARGGHREAHVAAVAARAGAATGTVYRHLPSKAAVFAEVFRRVSQREVDAARATAVEDPTATRRLVADLAAFCLRSVTDRESAHAGR
jgi:AcrR family transcriptional regulator